MSEIRIFTHPIFGEIRVTGTNDDPYFCLADICRSLELTPKIVKQRLSRGVVSNYPLMTAGGMQQVSFVNEDGFYDVVLDSRKPEAKAFRKWVTGEVLPTIRKTGGYIVTSEQDSPELIMARALQIAKATIDKHKQKLEQAQERITMQEKVIEEQQPKVLFANSIQASPESCYVKELADILAQNGIKIGQNRLFDWMKYNGYLCTSGAFKNQPKQKYIEMGLFQVDRKPFQKNGTTFISATTKVTPKGQQYFINKFLNKGMRTLNDMLVLRGEELTKQETFNIKTNNFTK